ncbi:TetR/AcrR family transcriptional regulator, repressor for uid operon [Hyphomicrobium sp. 1Nfss2.1]|uniref:TetR/AcrR family transcriptional regulator n=1 Tax=Hyphomicrobium sp. 1Nfss2.1 TaxID=3413936 RepID=UPI003C7E6788
MPKLKPATQRARREHVLDAAEACFARAGFHRTTMQDICKEAAISPGALYVYFASKEDLIAGIAERDRSEFAERFAELSSTPDFMRALSDIGQHYFAEEPRQKQTMCIEIALESTRNPRVGEIYRSIDRYVEENFEKLFFKLAEEGRIAPQLDIPTLTKLFSIIGDGLFMRRAVDPNFDAETLVPAAVKLIGAMLNAQPNAADTAPLEASKKEKHQ